MSMKALGIRDEGIKTGDLVTEHKCEESITNGDKKKS